MGPTASGKTALACEWVQQAPLEIISVDSAMIYRGMRIGTGLPDAQTLARAPHHLIEMREPTECYSAAAFCDDVARLDEGIRARGNTPLLVGGSMMYYRALQQGLSTLPKADQPLREALLQQAAEKGWAAMHADLKQVDPLTASRLHPNDTQRIQRALEIYQLTNRPLSSFLAEHKTETTYHFINIGLIPTDRTWLHQRIAKRFEEMLQEGLVSEVETLLQRFPLTSTHPSMRSVGYRQVWQYLHGEFGLDELADRGIVATRQLAKRQLTWLRHWSELNVLSAEDPTNLEKVVANYTYHE